MFETQLRRQAADLIVGVQVPAQVQEEEHQAQEAIAGGEGGKGGAGQEEESVHTLPASPAAKQDRLAAGEW
eukprot:1159189-Pelagomonas_calceolata.AAC.3